jgi:hypothetical protein
VRDRTAIARATTQPTSVQPANMLMTTMDPTSGISCRLTMAMIVGNQYKAMPTTMKYATVRALPALLPESASGTEGSLQQKKIANLTQTITSTFMPDRELSPRLA